MLRFAIPGYLSGHLARTICPLPPLAQSRSILLAGTRVTSKCKSMSTTTATAPPRHRFLVYAPDKTEEGTLEKRLSVRTTHLEAAKTNFANGLVRTRTSISFVRKSMF